ncbi:calponin homology domain-containing protein DDB_G0272472 [Neltuma alba]|uniref:calponin homology domain-containing protein DDB_G0272472 n=1 Tax=Neltuma alba TaxID=207710 RepID=UPI0010A4B805|nr:calponin homology domain-containing protein DDB_G0272472 [Prosopis alba]
MEEIFSHMDGKFEVTLTDSTMMWIVHCAMNRAQEKMKTKKGVIERLNEISKFYELAVLQLEGCLSFVQTETERNSFLDTNHQQVVSDLREIKDRLQRRLEESEMAISQKDRELTERLENEFKQRQQQQPPLVELQEREMASFGLNIELENTNSKNHDSDEHDGSSYEKMKTSADQQMMNISETSEPNVGEVPHSGIDTKKVEEMGCDIDILKQTLDVAFEKIQNAIFISEMGPKDQQWKLTTEKEIQSILVKSYMTEFQENIESEVKMQGMQVLRNWWDHWSQLMNEVTSLKHELELFVSQNEFHSEDYSNSSVLFSQENVSQEMVGKPASEQSGHLKLQEDEGTEDERNLVAKMVKKHQSITRRKSEELNISKYGLLLQEKRVSPTKKEKELMSSMKDTMQNISSRLDNLMTWNSTVSKFLFDRRVADHQEMNECTLKSAWENMKGISNARNEEQENKNMLNRDKEDKLSEKKSLDQGVVEEFHNKSFNSDIENQIEEGLFKFYLEETIKDWNDCIERECIESQIREELYFTVLSESAKDLICSAQETSKVDETDKTIREDIGKLVYKGMIGEYNIALEDYSASMEYRVGAIRDNFLNHLQLMSIESLVKEDICMVVLRCMLMEWKIELENYYLENLIKEQLHQFIVVETMREAIIMPMEVKSQHVQDKTMEEGAQSMMMLDQVHQVQSEEKFIKILLESLLNCFQAEENLMLSAKSEIKEHSRQLDLGSERGELHEHEIFEDLIIGEEQTFYSLTNKVEKALQQLGTSKELLSELGTTLSLRLCNSEKNLDQTTTREGEKSMSDLSPLFYFLHTFTEFEGGVNQKLEIETVRLESMNYCLELVAESIGCLRSKTSTFQKAFARRCQNLQKAELETINIAETSGKSRGNHREEDKTLFGSLLCATLKHQTCFARRGLEDKEKYNR